MRKQFSHHRGVTELIGRPPARANRRAHSPMFLNTDTGGLSFRSSSSECHHEPDHHVGACAPH